MKRQGTPETVPPPLATQPSPNNDPPDMATLELLAQWKQQDATENPDEIRVAEQEPMEFKKT